MLLGKQCNLRSKIPNYMAGVRENENGYALPAFYMMDDVITEKADRDFLNGIMAGPTEFNAKQYDILDFFGKS